jgi:hypothetical protein
MGCVCGRRKRRPGKVLAMQLGGKGGNEVTDIDRMVDSILNAVLAWIKNCIFVAVFVLVVFLILGGLGIIYNAIWGEQEGFTKTDDCRNTVMVQEGSLGTWFKKFTCTVKKTKSGKTISGVCVSVVTEGSVCQTVYTYSKKPAVECSDPKFPYLGYDDMCHSDYQ